MSLSTSNRRKAFRDKETSERLSVSQAVKQEFIGDLTRLLEEGYHGDITFIVGKEEFLAHAAILKARAPRFCDQFLPCHLNPSIVQVCIHLQGLTSDDFRQFLSSVYTDDVTPDRKFAKTSWTHEVVCSPLTKLIHESDRDHSCDGDSVFIHDEHIQLVDQHNSSDTAAVSDAAVVKETQQQRDHHACSPSLLGEDCSQDEPILDQTSQKDADAVFSVSERNDKLLHELKSYCCCPVGEDLVHLIDAEEGTDVVFVINDRKIRAHRAILCCRSRYFSAMLSGSWLEGSSNEIHLHDLSYDGFLTVLCYMYGGTARVPTNLAYIGGELLPLADMYGLTVLKDVICSELKIEKCHLFHKPCDICITSVLDCLRIAHLFTAFGCIEFKNSCIRWVARYFDRMCCTKGFAQLNQSLHVEILTEIKNGLHVSSAMDLLQTCHRLTAGTTCVKWAEPIHEFLSTLQDFCFRFSAQKFPVLVSDRSFLDVLKGVGWSTSLVESVFEAVNRNMCIETCCEQLRAVLRLQHMINGMLNGEVDRESAATSIYPEESIVLVERLHLQCKDYITSNLHQVRRTDAWKALSRKTQNDLREGAVIVDDFVDDGAGGVRSKPRPSNLFKLLGGSPSVNRQIGAPTGSQTRATISARAGQRGRLPEANPSKRGKSQPAATATPKRRASAVYKGTSSQRAVPQLRGQQSSPSVGHAASKRREGPSTGHMQSKGPRLEGASCGTSQNKGPVLLEGRPSDAQARSGQGRPSTGDVQTKWGSQNKGSGSFGGRPCDAAARSGRPSTGGIQNKGPNLQGSLRGATRNKGPGPLAGRACDAAARSGRPSTGGIQNKGPKLQGSLNGATQHKGPEPSAGRPSDAAAMSCQRRPSTGDIQNKGPSLQGSFCEVTQDKGPATLSGRPSDAHAMSDEGNPSTGELDKETHLVRSSHGVVQNKGPLETAMVGDRKGGPSVARAKSAVSQSLSSQSPNNRGTATGKFTSAKRSGRTETAPLQKPWKGATHKDQDRPRHRTPTGVQSSVGHEKSTEQGPSSAQKLLKDKGKQRPGKISTASASARPAWQRPSSVAGVASKNSIKKKEETSSRAPSSDRPACQRPSSIPRASSVRRVTGKSSNMQLQGKATHAPSSACAVRQRPLFPSISHANCDKQKQDQLLTVSNSDTPTSRSPSTVPSVSADPSSSGPVEQTPIPVPSSNGSANNKQQEGNVSIACSSSGSAWATPLNVPCENIENSHKQQQTKLPNASDSATRTWQRPSSAPDLLCKDTIKRQQGKQSTAPSASRPTKQLSSSAPSLTSEAIDSLKQGTPSVYLRGPTTICDGRHPTATTSTAIQNCSRSDTDNPSKDQNQNAGKGKVNATTILTEGDLVEASELPDSHLTQESDPSEKVKLEAVGCAQALQSCSSNVTEKVGSLCSEGSSGKTALSTDKIGAPEIKTRPKEITFVISGTNETKRNEDIPEILPDGGVSVAENTTKGDQSDRVRNITYVVKAAPNSEDAKEVVDQDRNSQEGATTNRDTNSANEVKPTECNNNVGVVLNCGVTVSDSDSKSKGRSAFDAVICVGTSVEGRVQAVQREATELEGGRVTDSGNESGSHHVACHLQEPMRVARVDLPMAHDLVELHSRNTQLTDVITASRLGSFPGGIVQTPRFVRDDSGACCLDWMPRGNSTPCSGKSARRPLNFSTKQKCLFGDESFDLSFGIDMSNDGFAELENSVSKES